MLDVNVKKDNMKTLEAYRAGLMVKPTLRNLFLELTMRCNERCLHCGSSCGDVASEELTAAQYAKFLAEVKGDFGTEKKMLTARRRPLGHCRRHQWRADCRSGASV